MALDSTQIKTDNTNSDIFAGGYGGNIINAQTGQITPVSPTINNGSIAPASPVPYASPTPTPIPDVSGLKSDYATPPLVQTDAEKQVNDLIKQTETLNNQTVGKSAEQIAQENAAGIPQLQTTQNDLKTQLLQLQNEAKAIPQQLQLSAEGRGITAGGLAPIQASSLRANAIAALGVSSLLDATNGLLASAQQKADRAVAAKYDPIQEQINANTKNLQLILNSPDYTVAEKNRAQAQLDIQKQKQDALDKEKQDTKDVNAVALEAAKNGADAVTLQKIMGSKNQAEAIQNAGTSLSANSVGFTLTQGQTRFDAKGNIIASVAPANTGGEISSNLPQVNMTPNNTPNLVDQQKFLNSIPDQNLKTLIQGLADYSISPSSVPTRNYRGVGGITQAQAIELAKQYDPTYDSKQYASRQAVLKQFTSGKYSQNINALNTAVGHIVDIGSNFAGLSNSGFTPYNAAKNYLQTLFGAGGVQRASLNIAAATGELASVFKGTGATDQEIHNLGTINENSSPDQVKAYIETATQLLASRLNALDETYSQGMGKSPDKSFLSPTSQQSLLQLQKNGLNIQVPELANSPLVKIQAFHDASPDNAKVLDTIRQIAPDATPDEMINILAQNGIQL